MYLGKPEVPSQKMRAVELRVSRGGLNEEMDEEEDKYLELSIPINSTIRSLRIRIAKELQEPLHSLQLVQGERLYRRTDDEFVAVAAL